VGPSGASVSARETSNILLVLETQSELAVI